MLQEFGKPVVLVADDDATTRYIFKETLAHEGFSVLEASNGREALDLCEACCPDLVLLDVEMPELDGYGACREIRESDAYRQMPVVMVTSHDDRQSIDLAYESGATDFIAKPISWPLLAHRLRYVLRGAENLKALGETIDENRALMAALPDHIFVLDGEGVVLEHLRGDAAPDCGPDGSWVGKKLATMFPEEEERQIPRLIDGVLEGRQEIAMEFEAAGLPRASNWRECRFIYHGREKILAIVRNISERKQAEARVHQLAFYDSLTSLPNRPMFRDRTGGALTGDAKRVAVFSIDLDRFKRINDTLGSAVGDATLVEVSQRLSAATDAIVGATDIQSHCLACFGGNVFALMLAGDLLETEPAAVCKRLGKAIAEPMRLLGHEFVVTASIGAACAPLHGRSVEGLLEHAEAARAEAKSESNNSYRVYRESMSADSLDCLDLENELRRALDDDGLVIAYQPKYRSNSDALVGAEALVRWEHPTRGEISPQVFIPIAEEAGLIGQLGEWVTNRVCQQIAAWQYTGLNTVPVAINVSGQEFVGGNPLDTVTRAVRRAGIEPGMIELEITETVLMSDIRSVVASLHELREAGFSLAVDDFGTGYSSLRYLQRFPVDTLKIDSSFVRDVETNADSRAICAAIIALARSLRLNVVGEGVETDWQRRFLEREGCDVLQGFLVDRPLRAADFEARLAGRAGQRTSGKVTELHKQR